MTEDEPKPRAVIDVTPDGGGGDPAPDVDADARPQEPPPRRGSRWTLAATLAVLALLVAGSAWGYWQLSELRRDLADLDGRMAAAVADRAELQQALDDAVAAFSGQQEQIAAQRRVLQEQRDALDATSDAFDRQRQLLADESLRMQEREAELRGAVADVYRRIGRSGNQWIIAETEYLMRIAGHRLALARDVATARVALELADQRLRDTGDPAWAGVREQLARELAELAAYRAPDTEGLAARLAALAEQAPHLPVAGGGDAPRASAVSVAATPTPSASGDASQRNWSTLVDDLWAGFKDTVRIREHDRPIQAMLPPEQAFFLRENLRLQLEAARAAVARGDAALYRDALARAAGWIDDHFAAGDAGTRAVRLAIDELRAVDMAPPLPEVGRSLRTLLARKQSMADPGPPAVENR